METPSVEHVKVILEGNDCYGEYAMAVSTSPTDEQLVAEAHLDRDVPRAFASVSGYEGLFYSIDFVEPDTHEINPTFDSAVDLAKLALSTVIDAEYARRHNEEIKEITIGDDKWQIKEYR